MPVSWGTANVLSKDEQIAYCSLALIPLLSKRQAEFWRKILFERETLTGKWVGYMITDIMMHKFLSEYVSSPVRYMSEQKIVPDN